MSLVTQFIKETSPDLAEIPDEVLQEFASEVMPDLVRAEKGINLRQESDVQLRKASQARITARMYEGAQNVFSHPFQAINNTLRRATMPTNEGIQRGGEFVSGSEQEPYKQITTEDLAAKAMAEPSETDTPIQTVGKAAYNTAVGAVGAITSGAGVLTAPMFGSASPLVRGTVSAYMAKDAADAAGRTVEAVKSGDDYGAAAGAMETLLLSAGAAGAARFDTLGRELSAFRNNVRNTPPEAIEAHVQIAREAASKGAEATASASLVSAAELSKASEPIAEIKAEPVKPKEIKNEIQVQEKGKQEEVVQQEVAVDQQPTTEPNRYLIGKSPQPWSEVSRPEPTPLERELGEIPVKVKNERTGEEAVVLESELRKVKPKREGEVDTLLGPGATTPEDMAFSESRMRDRKFHVRFEDTESIQLETRTGLRNKKYEVLGMDEVGVAVNTMIERKGIEGFMAEVLNPRSNLTGYERVIGTLNAVERLNEQAARLDKEGKAEQANYIRDRIINFVDTTSEQLGTEAGRTVVAWRAWSQMSPEGIVRDYQHKVKRVRANEFRKIESGIKSVTEVVKSKAFKEADIGTQRGMLMDAFKGLGRVSKSITRKVSELVEAAKNPELFDEAMMREIGNALKLPEVDQAFAREILKKAQEAKQLPEGFQRDFAMSKIAGEIRKKLGIGAYETAVAWWYASILSGPPTQVVNGVGGIMKVMTDVGLLSVLHPKSMSQILRGLRDGYADGYRDAKAIMKEGDYSRRERNLFEPTTLENLSDSPNLLKRALSYGKYVGRMMTAVDMVNFKGASEAFARLEAWKTAKKEGLSGPELQRRVDEILYTTKEDVLAAVEQAKSEGLSGNNAQRRVNEIIEQRRAVKLMEEARQFALEATYNQDPTGGLKHFIDAINGIKGKGGIAGTVATAIVPFTRIVGNVFNEQLNWTPYGYKRVFRMYRDGLAGTDAFNATRIKSMFGTASMVGLYSMIKMMEDENGDSMFDVSGPGPDDNDAKNALREVGWKPNTIRIGDVYISYLNTPFAMPFAMLGYFRDAEKYSSMSKKDILDRLAFTMSYAARSIFDQSFLTGISDFVEAISTRTDGKAMLGIVQRTGSGLVIPSLVKWMDSIWDPTITSGDTLAQRFLRDAPIARSVYGKPMLNALGEPVIREGSARFKMDRFWTIHKQDPVWNLFAEKSVFPHKPSKSTLINDKPITPEQYYKLVEIRGNHIKAAIENNMSGLKDMSKEDFQKWLSSVSREGAEIARDYIESSAN